ncbi:uncharacterized protein BDCG_08568 [Blastomyces dermatitidis ER-3]|uniref:Protein kinase domain-containing protein n=1 Tax=Ajellomyces dermatitidis (strain ER-3 / ATCC MYA-2586) TaxID=559297 RepID=A0ABP2EP71_AJEDR|nr:uncharacterized protein BDCG_08568 [Blastomyces dermatitidis ER-3]EEQ85299.2 hypothetical protein BDCG_08568 [Blastomyces dermatitidis ER-3]
MGQAFSRVKMADPDLENSNNNNVDINKHSSTFYGISFGCNVHKRRAQPRASASQALVHRIEMERFYLERFTINLSPSDRDKSLLALYSRWVLQTLSALHYIHTHSVFLSNFGANSIWLRADMSIAVTVFIATVIPTPIPGYDDLGVETNNYEYVLQTPENAYRSGSLELLEHGQPAFGAAYDLFDWATFMCRLLTNDYSTCPLPRPGGYHTSPLMTMDPASWKDFSNDRRPWKYEEKRQKEGAWHVLEEQRLGYRLVKRGIDKRAMKSSIKSFAMAML